MMPFPLNLPAEKVLARSTYLNPEHPVFIVPVPTVLI
jgi:hypothetical protein